MVTLKSTRSIGYIDFGNNDMYEVMKSPEGDVVLCSHWDEFEPENPDGTYNSTGFTIEEFMSEISDRHDFDEIMVDLKRVLDSAHSEE